MPDPAPSGLGRWVPGLDVVRSAVEVGDVSLPIAVGLVLMVYPVPAGCFPGDPTVPTPSRSTR